MSTEEQLPAAQVEAIARGRRHPRRTQFDYLHARSLVEDLDSAVRAIEHPVDDVLDVFCGTKPYRDLFPPDARYVGLDINRRYGRADVVSTDFLPFDDASFDVIVSTQAFHYVADLGAGLHEVERVLRPGGTVILTVPVVWEYERDVLEHRFTARTLAALFTGWAEVEILENGGRAVTWATLTGRMVNLAENALGRGARGVVLRPLFPALYVLVNATGAAMQRVEERFGGLARTVLPMNLLVRARRS